MFSNEFSKKTNRTSLEQPRFALEQWLWILKQRTNLRNGKHHMSSQTNVSEADKIEMRYEPHYL
eukprot:330933-Amphidinium_carterae.2